MREREKERVRVKERQTETEKNRLIASYSERRERDGNKCEVDR